MLGVAPLTAATTHLSFLKENVMSEQPRPYEPLTSENAALILIDHQVGLMTGVRDYSTGELKHNVVGLAKAAKALKNCRSSSQRPRGTACGARPFQNPSRRCLAFQSSIARL
jgi:hypothetical protein